MKLKALVVATIASIVASSPSITELAAGAASASSCHSCFVPLAAVLGIADSIGVSSGEML